MSRMRAALESRVVEERGREERVEDDSVPIETEPRTPRVNWRR